ncbi:hypothetical protein HFO09_08290 [Rhizobium laguerreae]|uniref:Uncharacterized protein n=1 Tax=Rhizobium leguminosarum TaxID=384 RepID=A0A6P0DML3_RHILE|nr:MULTISPECIES: hypothetical protein [Rhizobium]MBY3255688.1 hypothetical protein [Rhizobium laguerreae]MBY3282727.1 hypothetical protein [Rhizobium laguerreae]MBY3289081.1 hypothetical protein [Rhizobium laguerreae]NEK53232.1 hypothetical protein [Rhizobium leguminosarum]
MIGAALGVSGYPSRRSIHIVVNRKLVVDSLKPAIVRRIEQSKRDFERETQSRRRMLQAIHALIERRLAEPSDELVEAVERQWKRLAVYHLLGRHRQPPSRPPLRLVQPVPDDPRDWRAYHWQLDRSRLPVSNVRNAVAALRESPMLSGIVALDQRQNAIMLKAPLPFAHWETFDFEMRRFKEQDLTALREYLQHIGLSTLSRDDCLAAVRLAASENAWWADE